MNQLKNYVNSVSILLFEASFFFFFFLLFFHIWSCSGYSLYDELPVFVCFAFADVECI